MTGRNTVAIDPGKLDRSPCGTGCSARMAVLHARGEMGLGDRFVARSIIGSRFDCEIAELGAIGDREAVVPRIRGRAWITGTQQLMLDPDDPWPLGYRLSDTWPQTLMKLSFDSAKRSWARRRDVPSKVGDGGEGYLRSAGVARSAAEGGEPAQQIRLIFAY